MYSFTGVFYGLAALLKGITEFVHSWVTGTSCHNSWKNEFLTKMTKRLIVVLQAKTLQGFLHSSLSNFISLVYYVL